MRPSWAIIGLALWSGSVAGAVPARDPIFPKVGTRYAEARQSLLRQGLTLSRRKPARPNATFRELDCSGSACRALFTFKNAEGWRLFVLAEVDPATLRTTYVGLPRHGEDYHAIPPPEPKDIPGLPRDYGKARLLLKRRGYHSVRVGDQDSGPPGYPEMHCFMDIAECDGWWLAPDGRLLKVLAVGEQRRTIYFKTWATRAERAEMLAPRKRNSADR